VNLSTRGAALDVVIGGVSNDRVVICVRVPTTGLRSPEWPMKEERK
jgi:hypothetical protein